MGNKLLSAMPKSTTIPPKIGPSRCMRWMSLGAISGIPAVRPSSMCSPGPEVVRTSGKPTPGEDVLVSGGVWWVLGLVFGGLVIWVISGGFGWFGRASRGIGGLE